MTSYEPIVKRYFIKIEDENDCWICSCGKKLRQKKGSGWSNLMNHIKSQHPEHTNFMESKYGIFVADNSTRSGTSLNLNGWIEWVCVSLKPFSFIEDPLTRKYTNLGFMSNVTLKKYMNKLSSEVEKRISKELPGKFALIIDGWSKKSNHFVGLFASYPWSDKKGYRSALLSFLPLINETLTASDLVDFISYTLSLYGKSFENVVAIICDNAEVNKSITKLSDIPLVVCASHKFNLAVSAYLENEKLLLDKINNLMGKLKSFKLADKLREMTTIKPIQRDISRWSTTYDMVERFIQIEFFLESFKDDPRLIDYILTSREHQELKNLEENLRKLRSVSDALQREEIDLYDVRVLFNEILVFYPCEEFRKYLLPSADIVHCPDFENGIVKILQKSEEKLSEQEIQALGRLEFTEHLKNLDSLLGDDDFASICLKKRRVDPNVSKKYPDCRFILPSSNITERLFSSAGYSLDEFRQSLSSSDLEKQLFLKANRIYWNEEMVSTIFNEL
ncbi:hypothetical protein Ahia01_000558600 [Argonauta hians]